MNKLEQAARQALGALVRAEAMYGQPNADIQTALRSALADSAAFSSEALAEQAEQEPVAYLHQWSEYHPFGDTVVGEPMQNVTRDSTPFDESDTVTPLYAAPVQQITTPDVCGEVCARAKLCYGCNKDLEEANAKFAEQAEQEPIEYLMEVTCTKCGATESGVLEFKTPQSACQEPRAWVELTKQDMQDIARATLGRENMFVFNAVVNAFKAKNTALREALAEQVEQEPEVLSKSLKRIQSLERQLKIAQQQWDNSREYALELAERLFKYEGGSPMLLNSEQAEQQEPVGHVLSDGTICWDEWCPDAGTLLYTAPPQREWVEPSDEQIDKAIDAAPKGRYTGARDVLKLAKELNHD